MYFQADNYNMYVHLSVIKKQVFLLVADSPVRSKFLNAVFIVKICKF